MEKICLALLLGLLTTTPLYSEAKDSTSTSGFQRVKKYHVGINAGLTTGIGFSFRYMDGNYGLQGTLLPIVTKKDFYESFGLTFLRDLKDAKNYRLLFYASNHVSNFFSTEVKFKDSVYDNLGLGLGVDYFNREVIIKAMVGYAAYGVPNDIRLWPTAEFSISYPF